MSDSTNTYPTVQPLSPSDEKLWATLIHIGGIILGFLPAVVGYIVLKDRGPFIRQHSATAFNFQLTLLLAYFVGFITSLLVIGILIMIAAGVVNLIFSIMAAIAANNGEYYTYPLSIRFVS